MFKTVLCYLEKDNQYLVMYRNKKIHDRNKNKYIGIGGHIEQGETPEQALIREVKEETDLDIKSYEYRGLIHFVDSDFEEDMYLFTSKDYFGELKECNEGTLMWIDKEELLTLPIWEGDKYFLELLNKNEKEFELLLKYVDGDLKEHKLIN